MSRIERARRRVTLARYAIGITAAVALGGFAAVARVTHPGTAPRVATARTITSSSTSDDSSSSFFGQDDGSYSNIGPSGSAQPQVQSGAS
jgi:hypothetical protein